MQPLIILLCEGVVSPHCSPITGDDASWVKMWAPLATVIAGVITAAVVLFQRWKERDIARTREQSLLKCELLKIQEHYRKNTEVFDKILGWVNQSIDKGDLRPSQLPSVIHLRKLKLPESFIVFNDASLRVVSADHIDNIIKLKLRLHNRNTEVDSIIQYIGTNPFDLHEFKAFCEALRDRHNDAAEDARTSHDKLPSEWSIPGSEEDDLKPSPEGELILVTRPSQGDFVR